MGTKRQTFLPKKDLINWTPLKCYCHYQTYCGRERCGVKVIGRWEKDKEYCPTLTLNKYGYTSSPDQSRNLAKRAQEQQHNLPRIIGFICTSNKTIYQMRRKQSLTFFSPLINFTGVNTGLQCSILQWSWLMIYPIVIMTIAPTKKKKTLTNCKCINVVDLKSIMSGSVLKHIFINHIIIYLEYMYKYGISVSEWVSTTHLIKKTVRVTGLGFFLYDAEQLWER